MSTEFQRLADLLYPDVTQTPADLEKRFPPRELPDGAAVTRFAPSPTGYVHFGSFIPIMTSSILARRSRGVFYLRIEDTDKKREVENGVIGIINDLDNFEIVRDEGARENGESGSYGPYLQSARRAIYEIVAKDFVRRGVAYPCFCTPDALGEVRAKQEAAKETPGYYGAAARCRSLSYDDIENKIKNGVPWILRMKSPGDPSRRFEITDLVKGHMSIPENFIDHVIMKTDGLPPYHFAHLVDDHFMRTTHIVRGDEWLATLPVHVQLFEMAGYALPEYVHISPVMKTEGESKRKLSKRKDPEAAMSYYFTLGYPVEAVQEYTMTLLNSNFEEWRAANPAAPLSDFPFSTDRMSASGALFDLVKLNDISKNVISRMDKTQAAEKCLSWAEKFDQELYKLLSNDIEFTESIFSIGRGGEKPRKDLTVWSDVKPYLDFFFDELFTPDYTLPENVSKIDAAAILEKYAGLYDASDNQPEWFSKIRSLAPELGFAAETKAYKADPSAYKGHIGDVSAVLRAAVTGRANSPDMHAVMAVLGRARVIRRLGMMRDALAGN